MFKIPVIASNVYSKEIIRNGKTGFLVNYNNDLRMANRIKKYLIIKNYIILL